VRLLGFLSIARKKLRPNKGLMGKLISVLVVVIVLLFTTIIDRAGDDVIDPNDLPPPAAGMARQEKEDINTCEGVIFGVSQDGLKFVREAGGGNIYAALVDEVVTFYVIGRYDHMTKVDYSELFPGIATYLQNSLLNCVAHYLPSGISFQYSGFKL